MAYYIRCNGVNVDSYWGYKAQSTYARQFKCLAFHLLMSESMIPKWVRSANLTASPVCIIQDFFYLHCDHSHILITGYTCLWCVQGQEILEFRLFYLFWTMSFIMQFVFLFILATFRCIKELYLVHLWISCSWYT